MNPIEPNEHLLSRLQEVLTDRELLIMRMRLGFTSNPPMTLQEIGLSLNLTRERVRQIQHDALLKLADPKINSALLVESIIAPEQKPNLFRRKNLRKTNAVLKNAVEQKFAVGESDQITVYFNKPVAGQDPQDKDFFNADRHKLFSTWARQDGETTTFLDDDGVIVASCNTRDIKTIQWPSGELVPPTTTAFANRMEEITSRYPRAWSKWSYEEDQKLIREFQSGMKVRECCETHGRARGGIISRLRKLELIAQDDKGTGL
jgi:hypothetical protein